MKKWEDIVRDKMEEPEGELPESVFAEFRARREAAAASPAPKRFPLVWAVVPAVAAGLAAVLLLQKPSVPDGDIKVVQQPSTQVAEVIDSTTVIEPEKTTPHIAHTVITKEETQEPEIAVTITEEETIEPEVNDTEMIEPKDTSATKIDQESPVSIPLPFIPQSVPTKPVKMKVGTAVGAVAGGGVVVALATPLLGGFKKNDNAMIADRESAGLEPPKDELTGVVSHSFPLMAGLSTRIPLAESLNLTTGLEYSLYSSIFTYTLSGEKTQLAHYLGVPVRLDWTLASNRWLDVYVGGGFEGDYCVGATLGGDKIDKDGFGLSLLGAGGIQLNLTKQIGLYVEPEISWTIPSESHVLQTYRSDKTMMFSLTSGLRFNFGK